MGQGIAGNSRGGILVTIGLGLVGALFGMFLARALRLPELVWIAGFPITWSIIWAALFVALRMVLTRRRLS